MSKVGQKKRDLKRDYFYFVERSGHLSPPLRSSSPCPLLGRATKELVKRLSGSFCEALGVSNSAKQNPLRFSDEKRRRCDGLRKSAYSGRLHLIPDQR